MVLSIEPMLLLSAAMFLMGAVGVIVRKNVIVVFMCLELMLNAANLTFISSAGLYQSLDSQITVLIVMTVAAAEAAIGLAIVLALFRTKKSVDTPDASILRS